MSTSAPDRIPGYRILHELGRGGMATVYLAIQESLGREVALKLLSPRLAEDAASADAFVREARIAAKLVHRHIVGIHEVGRHDGQPYLAMEFLPGGTVARDAVDPSQALEVAREIALALDHAHREGVIHRDIKPENILRRADGSSALADFGIARTAEAGTGLTQEGATLGTPHYMSPEQLQGQALDGRSDLYSLGVVLFQSLTGQLPYQGTDGWAVGVQHINAPIPTLPTHLARFQSLIDALMAKKPAQRPQSGADAARLIGQLQTGDVPVTQALPSRAAQGPRPTFARNRGTILALALLLIGAGGWFVWQRAAPPTNAGIAPDASKASAGAAPVAEPQNSRSIAVLPLANISGKPENEYLSDGLAETMRDMLGRVPDLKVIARTSSLAFKDKAMDVGAIGRALNASHLLEGSVQQSGDQLRIFVQLVRASDGASLWSQRYDRPLADVFKVQDEVAGEVVKALQGALPAATGKTMSAGGTRNTAAYDQYLRGTQLLSLRKVDELRAALAHFEKAIELDPLYARAYAAAANAMILIDSHAGLTPTEIAHRAELVRRALELDPTLGEAYIARAGTLQGSDNAAAERDYQRGIALAPNYATGLQWYGEMLAVELGRPEEAAVMLQRAISLDPMAPVMRAELSRVLMLIGQIDAAERVIAHLKEKHPEFPLTHAADGGMAEARGDLARALRASRTRIAADPVSSKARIDRCQTLAKFGAMPQATACLRSVEKLPGAHERIEQLRSMLATYQGDLALALRSLEALEAPMDWHRGVIARLRGNHAAALAIYRETLPHLLAEPLGTPHIASRYDFIDVGATLLAVGKKAQAERLLRYGLKSTAGRPRVGEWADVMALSLLGENARACALMEAAAVSGEYVGFGLLAVEPDLAGLRREPCFAPAYAKLKALADAQIEAAARANLF